MEEDRRCLYSLHTHLFNQKTTAQRGTSGRFPAPCCSSQLFHPNASANPRGQAFDFIQQFRPQDAEENKCPASPRSQLLRFPAAWPRCLRDTEGFGAKRVANENRSKSVKCITIPEKMEWDFPTIGFISRKWINIILRGHFAQTRCPLCQSIWLQVASVGMSNTSLLTASHVTAPLASGRVHRSVLENGRKS